MSKYAEGYQDALRDIAAKWDVEGEAAAREWIRANLVIPVKDLLR